MRTGEQRRAMELLDQTLADARQLVNTGDERPGVLREIAAIYAAKGDREQAYGWYQRAIEAGWRLEMIHPSPLLYSLSGDLRFQGMRSEIDADIRREKARLEIALAGRESER
jgi:tetratricopeptide (TPR) repeat protein